VGMGKGRKDKLSRYISEVHTPYGIKEQKPLKKKKTSKKKKKIPLWLKESDIVKQYCKGRRTQEKT